jgi:bacterioferritin-associated ferredoxin
MGTNVNTENSNSAENTSGTGSSGDKLQFKASWPGHDEIFLEYCVKTKLVTSLRIFGCLDTINKFKELVQTFKTQSVLEWPIPMGIHHSDMLIRELLLKIHNKWDYPYKEEEICHCRAVDTIIVDQAVMGGAHTIHQISLETGAATACSACQVNIEKIIQYRLKP